MIFEALGVQMTPRRPAGKDYAQITTSTVASHPFLGFRLTRELENFRWYHVLGPHLGHTARVDVDFRSGAHLFYGVMS